MCGAPHEGCFAKVLEPSFGTLDSANKSVRAVLQGDDSVFGPGTLDYEISSHEHIAVEHTCVFVGLCVYTNTLASECDDPCSLILARAESDDPMIVARSTDDSEAIDAFGPHSNTGRVDPENTTPSDIACGPDHPVKAVALTANPGSP